MIQRARWVMALLVGLASLSAQSCQLPTAEQAKTPLTLVSINPDTIVIGDTTTLSVVARDPAGRTLLDPPVAWSFLAGSQPTLTLLRSEDGKATVVGQHIPNATARVSVPSDNARFTSNALADVIVIRYGPLTVHLMAAGPDTVLTSRGKFYLRAFAVDPHGNQAVGGIFTAKTQGRSVEFVKGWGDAAQLNATGIGPDTVAVSYSLCPEACADTIVVDVEPVPVSITFPHHVYWANTLNRPFQISAIAEDQNGYPVPGVPFVWHLSDANGILSLGDSLTGTFTAQANGTAEVQVTSGGLAALHDVYVQQEAAVLKVDVPYYVIGVGTNFSATFHAWDWGGTPLDSLLQISQLWSTQDPSVAIVTEAPGGIARTAELQTQRYGDTPVDLTVTQCAYDCTQAVAQSTVHVIPEPDSVAVDFGPYSTVGAGSTFSINLRVYLPGDSTFETRTVSWESLDPTVATIDSGGGVTAVAAGTARIVGALGAAADTAVLTVVQ